MYYASITSQLLDSDHCVIFLTLWVMRRFKTKTKPCQSILNLNHQRLSNPEIKNNLCEEVMRTMGLSTPCSGISFFAIFSTIVFTSFNYFHLGAPILGTHMYKNIFVLRALNFLNQILQLNIWNHCLLNIVVVFLQNFFNC